MIHEFLGKKPLIHPSVHIVDSAEIIGDVTMGKESSAWFNVTIRADVNWIKIGQRSNVQDNVCIHVMNNYESKELINIGTGVDITIRELAQTICEVIDYRGDLVWDISKPNGMMRKVLDIQKLESLGWQPKIALKAGIQKVVNYLDGEYVED